MLVRRCEEQGRLKAGEEEEIDDTPERIALISRFNGLMTPAQVEAALNEGKRVYTLFSSFSRGFKGKV